MGCVCARLFLSTQQGTQVKVRGQLCGFGSRACLHGFMESNSACQACPVSMLPQWAILQALKQKSSQWDWTNWPWGLLLCSAWWVCSFCLFPPKRLINKLIIVRTIFVRIIQNNLRILAFWSEKKQPQHIRMDEPYSILQSQFWGALQLGEVWNDLTLVVQAYLSMRLLVCRVHGAWRSHPWGWHPHHFRY